MNLEISFYRVSLRLGFSNFWSRGLRVSDFCLSANGFKPKISRQGVKFENS